MTSLMNSARKHFEVSNKLTIANLINLFNPNENLLTGVKDFSNDFINFNSHVVITNEFYNGYKVVHCTQAWNSVQAYKHLEKGKTYTFSCYAKSDKENARASFYMVKAGEPNYTIPNKSPVKLTTEWNRYTLTFKVMNDFNCYLRIEQYNDNNLYLAGYKLEEGSLATPLTELGGVTKVFLSALRRHFSPVIGGVA